MILTFKNSNNQSIEFSEKSDYTLVKVEGLGDLSLNLYTSKSSSQDGESYEGNTLQARDIHVESTIVANNEEDMTRKRNHLISSLNVKLGQLEIIYKNENKKAKIDGIVENLHFPHEENFGEYMQKVLIDIYCANPYLKTLNETKTEIALWRKSFHFPLIIPKNEGIIMGYREPSLIVNVNNTGQVTTGMRIEFKAKGTVVNPSLFNINTRKFIKINKTMTAGEKIIVNTNLGEKKILSVLNGVTTDILNLLDLVGGGKTFLQLDVGDNLFRYDADEGIDNLEIDIYYDNKYLGV